MTLGVRRARARLLPVAVTALAVASLLATEHCMVVTGDYQVGAVATLAGCTTTATTSTCPTGQSCVGGVCETACGSDGDCSSNWHCVSVPGQTGASAGKVCMPHCNPAAPQQPDGAHVACDIADSCQVLVLAGGNQVTDCVPVESSPGSQGAVCTDYTACSPGYACLESGAANQTTCLRYCRMGQSDCAAGLTCSSFTPPILDGPQEVGFCLP